MVQVTLSNQGKETKKELPFIPSVGTWIFTMVQN